MISREEATQMFKQMIAEKGNKVSFDDILEDDGVFVLLASGDDGTTIWPGSEFQSIRISDGELVDYFYPIPT